jgi:hypothetical protein
MNWKRCGRKCPCPAWRNSPDICLEVLRKIMKILSQVAAKMWTGYSQQQVLSITAWVILLSTVKLITQESRGWRYVKGMQVWTLPCLWMDINRCQKCAVSSSKSCKSLTAESVTSVAMKGMLKKWNCCYTQNLGTKFLILKFYYFY